MIYWMYSVLSGYNTSTLILPMIINYLEIANMS